MSLVSRLPHIARLLALLPVVLMLTACEQQDVGQPTDTVELASEQGIENEPVKGVTSIDANGNIAPFGFASRQPVPVIDPLPAIPPTPTMANSELYGIYCVACHGAAGNGIEGLGVSLLASDLVGQATETELIGFLQIGRPGDSPDNTTGVPMPSFDWMQREELEQLVRYVKSLQGR